MVRPAVSYQSVWETVQTSWGTIPYHVQPNNTRAITRSLHAHSKGKNTERIPNEKINTIKRKARKKNNVANMRKEGASRDQEVAGCWYEQSNDTSS